jgi:hypothetical protein
MGVFIEIWWDERWALRFLLFDRIAMLAGTAASFTTPGIDNGTGGNVFDFRRSVRLVSGN